MCTIGPLATAEADEVSVRLWRHRDSLGSAWVLVGCLRRHRREQTYRPCLGSEEWIAPLEEYSFGVTRSWKGPAVPELRLRQGYHNCDNAFVGGETYLIFASTNEEDPSAYTSGKCGPTTQIVGATRHIEELGPPAATLRVSRPPLKTLSPAYFARLYFWSALAAHLNAIRHAHNSYAWQALGIGALLAMSAVLFVVASAISLIRRRGLLATGLFAFAMILAIGSVFAGGASFLQNGFYTHYKDWKP